MPRFCVSINDQIVAAIAKKSGVSSPTANWALPVHCSEYCSRRRLRSRGLL